MAAIADFINQKCDVIPSAEVPKAELYKQYFDWALGNRSTEPVPRSLFSAMLYIAAPMIEPGNGEKRNYFRGVRIAVPVEFIADKQSPWDQI